LRRVRSLFCLERRPFTRIRLIWWSCIIFERSRDSSSLFSAFSSCCFLFLSWQGRNWRMKIERMGMFSLRYFCRFEVIVSKSTCLILPFLVFAIPGDSPEFSEKRVSMISP
jgi:hypothetical protein